jgi:hypothetical protein
MYNYYIHAGILLAIPLPPPSACVMTYQPTNMMHLTTHTLLLPYPAALSFENLFRQLSWQLAQYPTVAGLNHGEEALN